MKDKTTKKPGIIRRTAKSFIDIPRWMSWNELTDDTKTVGKLIRTLFRKPKTVSNDNFAQACARYHVTKDDLGKRAKEFLILTFIYLAGSFGIFGYAIYQFSKDHISAGIFCVCLAGLAASYAFKQHFWYMQVKKQKMGCTFQEWLDFILKRTHNNNNDKVQ